MAIKDITLGQYYPAESPVHRLDPRTKIIGTVVQVIPGTGAQTQLRLAPSGYSDVVFVTIDYDLGYNILDNDKLTIYGTLNGLMTYESVLKETISIPLVAADEVKLQ